MTGALHRVALLIGACACAGLTAAGCGEGGGAAATPSGLRLQREDLIVVAHALASVQPEVQREVAATKAAWPSVAGGLPSNVSAVPAPPIRAAAREAGSLRIPAVLGEREAASLTGPASGVAGSFRGFAGLAGRGWQMIEGVLEQIERGTSGAATFARANAPLYIDSVYDAHFELAQVGKHLLSAYQQLGGQKAFGSALTQAEVERLAGAYSEANDRLHPHPGVKLGS